MAFADRSSETTYRQGAPRSGRLMAGAGMLLAAVIATLTARQLVPAEAVAPITVTLLFAGGGVAAGLALLSRRDWLRVLWFDLAGGMTFVGIVISVFIEPDQLAGLFTASNQPE
jgi:hypothetical protein